MREIYKTIGKVAPSDITILIQGESVAQGAAVAAQDWLPQHVHEANGSEVLDQNGKRYTVPAADLLP